MKTFRTLLIGALIAFSTTVAYAQWVPQINLQPMLRVHFDDRSSILKVKVDGRCFLWFQITDNWQYVVHSGQVIETSCTVSID